MRKQPALVAALIILLTMVAYLPVLKAGFIELDDPLYVFANKVVQGGLTWAGIKWAFTTGTASNWHPLTWLSHMLDWQIYGSNTSGHHATNLALHVANCVLLFLWLVRVTRSTWRSALASGLFALHPIHVESVAWISERKDVLSGFFFILTLLAYTRYVECGVRNAECGIAAGGQKTEDNHETFRGPGQRTEDRRQVTHRRFNVLTFQRFKASAVQSLNCSTTWYCLTLLAFALGLMGKPMLVTVPFVLLLLDYWPLERFNFQSERARIKSLVVEKVPFLILSTASSVVTYLVQGRGHAFDLGRTFGLEVRLGNAAVSYLFYLWKSFWPVKLAAFYPYQSQSDEAALAAVLILLGLTGLCVWRSRVNRAWIVGWLWFVGMLVPVIGFVQVGVQAHADRYMYLPLIGLLLILIGGAMPDVAQRRLLIVCAPLAMAVLACGWLTFRQAALWRDTDTLFRYTLSVAPENPVALHTYGLSLLRQGRNQEAAELYAEAIRVWPQFCDAYISLGTALGKQGQTERAIAVYQEALQYSPELLLVHFNLGVLLEQKGKLDEACAHYAEALRISPEYFEALLGLGRVKLAQGEADLALQYFQQAVRLQPKSRDARLQTATALAARGDLDQARSELGLALGVESDSAQAHHQLALALETSHRWPEALNEFKQALTRDPNSAVILNNLAWVLAAHPDGAYRNGPEAVRLAEKARELTRGEQPIILGTLAAAYAEAGRFADAQATAREAIALAEKAGLTDVAQKNRQLLDLYVGGKPYRDPSLGATQR